jgi:hypothetical protein
MRGRITLLAAGIALVAAGAGAGPAGAANTQQDRMKACNAEAGAQSLAGDARKQFMSDCLSGKAMPAAMSKEQACTADADVRKLSGAARTSFLKKCVGS